MEATHLHIFLLTSSLHCIHLTAFAIHQLWGTLFILYLTCSLCLTRNYSSLPFRYHLLPFLLQHHPSGPPLPLWAVLLATVVSGSLVLCLLLLSKLVVGKSWVSPGDSVGPLFLWALPFLPTSSFPQVHYPSSEAPRPLSFASVTCFLCPFLVQITSSSSVPF